MQIRRTNEKGFTLPEILVVTTVIVVFVVVSVALLRPVDLTNNFYNAQRRTDIAELAQALQRYKKNTGSFPATIPTSLTGIGSSERSYDMCAFVVPSYLSDLPSDPRAGLSAYGDEQAETDKPCNIKGVSYITGYSIMRNADGTLTLTAPSAVEEKIEIVIR